MNTNFINVGSKSVQLSQPFNATVSDMVGREAEMRKILAAWMCGNSGFPLSPLLLSEPGIGKNRITYEAARVCGKDLFVFQGHEEVTSDDLVCTVRFSDDPERKMDYILSPLASAMLQKNAICFIDEIAKIRPRALAPLASLLDERRYIDSNILGERIYASPGFRFIAASNTIDLEGDMFPDFIRSRMRPIINVGYPVKDEIDRIIRSRFQTLHNNGNALLDLFWKLWRDKNGDRSPTPRDSIYIFGYALNLADFEAIEGNTPYLLEGANGDSNIKQEHIEQAFAAFHDIPEEIG
jgi:MoxR-like ATPase